MSSDQYKAFEEFELQWRFTQLKFEVIKQAESI